MPIPLPSASESPAAELRGAAQRGGGGTLGGVLGEVDLFSAQVLVHERAIYIHESVQYYVDRLEWHERKAYVAQVGDSRAYVVRGGELAWHR